MVVEPQVFDYLSEDESCSFEGESLDRLAKEKKLGIYKHYDFWQCMDTQRDKHLLEQLWGNKKAPWKVW